MKTLVVTLQNSVIDQHNEYNQALWHHSCVWHLFGDKQTSKSHQTYVAYSPGTESAEGTAMSPSLIIAYLDAFQRIHCSHG